MNRHGTLCHPKVAVGPLATLRMRFGLEHRGVWRCTWHVVRLAFSSRGSRGGRRPVTAAPGLGVGQRRWPCGIAPFGLPTASDHAGVQHRRARSR